MTNFVFRLHPVSTVMAGPIFYAIEDAPAVMKAYEEFITAAPEDISGFFAFMVVPKSKPCQRCRIGRSQFQVRWVSA